MDSTHYTILALWALYNLFSFLLGYRQCKFRKNAYGLTPFFYFNGSFVWGDAVVFGVFWLLVSIGIALIKDWVLFLLIVSLFWVVRSLGETMYWFNEQFAPNHRNPHHALPRFGIFHDDAIWFIYQVTAQCITVISLIFSLYFATVWLQGKV